MALDDNQRKALQNLARDARKLLTDEFTAQLQEQYGIQPNGSITELKQLGHLDDERFSVAGRLRERIHHLAGVDPRRKELKEAIHRTVREQAFTVLNRFVALRMAEERGLVQECVREGFTSKGFRVYNQVAGPSMGDTYQRYVVFLHCLFDEIALDLGVLFDRDSPFGLLFPRAKALDALLKLINADDLQHVWTEDESIGWTYQYFNSKDEIKEMRDKGRSGPRNSREMAVRNQFFTPHYVVQFLVNNTLGRVWVEMTKGDTELTNHLAYYSKREKEHFLDEGERVPEPPEEGATYVPHRPIKDPREIRLLDPACGSMHFGLYAFDVYERIYLEAWDRYPELLKDLREEHDRPSFKRLIPKLILEHNLHGVDIDPRALQIAGLALWLRAQRSWQQQGVKPEDRPRIRRSHLVCAEPMPGGEDLLDELRADLERRYPTNGKLLGELVAEVWDRMQLAGEAGPLLKIEQELEGTIERARKTAETARQSEIFGDGADEDAEFSVKGISRRFFYGDGPLPMILSALHELATSGEGKDGYRRRLFEDDAAQGLAFIELLRQRFDVVVMNPPFGDPSVNSKKYIEDAYTDTKNDVLQAFVERAGELLVPGGYLGAITSRTPFFLSSAQAWRERVVLRLFRPQLLADFGMGVLDAMVETAAYVLRSLTEDEDRALTLSLIPDLLRVERTKNGTFSIPKYRKARNEGLKRHQAENEIGRLMEAGLIYESTAGRGRSFELVHNAIKRAQAEQVALAPSSRLVCFRLIGEDDRATSLLEAINESDDPRQFVANPGTFADVPGAPFAYWVSDRVRRLFKELPPFESGGRTAQHGLSTKDDFRYLRLWWEVQLNERCRPSDHPTSWSGTYCVREARWFPFAKGGSYSPYVSLPNLLVNWHRDGLEMEADVLRKYHYLNGNAEWVLHRGNDYFRPGITWSKSTTSRISLKVLPSGCLFADMGLSAFVEGDRGNTLAHLGMMNSDVFVGLLALRLGLADSGRKHYEVGLVRSLPIPTMATSDERVNTLISLVSKTVSAKNLSLRFREGSLHFVFPRSIFLDEATEYTNYDLDEVRRQIDEIASSIYDLGKDDIEGLSISLSGLTIPGHKKSDEDEDDDLQSDLPSSTDAASGLISYLLGVVLGRWDVRFATGQKEPPPLPDPFDPLPVCSPGMLQDYATSLPLEIPPVGYPIAVPEHGIIVDDDTHPHGLFPRLREVLHVIFGERAATIEQEAAEILGVRTLEDYFRRPTAFFDAHLKQYSKSRRKAPIYWPLSVPSGQYTLWVYYPRLTAQTLYTAINEFVDPKLDSVAGDIRRLQVRIHDNGSRKDRDRLDDLVELQRELKAFREELLRVAKLPYKPNLNDGVELTAAPLHRLFQHTQWQRHLEKRWTELEEGKYDWAHIAYAIWPDRVRQVCREDKSIAIAHGLEELYESEEASTVE